MTPGITFARDIHVIGMHLIRRTAKQVFAAVHHAVVVGATGQRQPSIAAARFGPAPALLMAIATQVKLYTPTLLRRAEFEAGMARVDQNRRAMDELAATVYEVPNVVRCALADRSMALGSGWHGS